MGRRLTVQGTTDDMWPFAATISARCPKVCLTRRFLKQEVPARMLQNMVHCSHLKTTSTLRMRCC